MPLFVTSRCAADALSVTRRTIAAWIEAGELRGIQRQSKPHYTDVKPRKTSRGRWLVELDSMMEMLERMYAGEPVPRPIRQRLRAIAAKSPQP